MANIVAKKTHWDCKAVRQAREDDDNCIIAHIKHATLYQLYYLDDIMMN